MAVVSIVMPVYNGEKYLRQSIASVVNQTFKDWNLIIVDDCSTDSSPEIMNEYAKADDRIQVIHNEVNSKHHLIMALKRQQADILPGHQMTIYMSRMLLRKWLNIWMSTQIQVLYILI